MKETLKDVLFGFAVLFSIMLLEFLVTIPFGTGGSQLTPAEFSYIMNREFLLTAIPAAVVTYLFTALRRTETRSEAIRHSAIWTLMILLLYFLMGIGNDNLGEIFSTVGIYVLLAAAFAGPLLYARLRHLGGTARRV